MQKINRTELANSKVAGGCHKSSCDTHSHHHNCDPCDKPKDPCQPAPSCEPTPSCNP